MSKEVKEFDRVVIGGGLFGCYSALLLAKRGHRVALIEQSSDLLTRASYVNQARLHTGLHYPRSLLTAMEALEYYEMFRNRFPSAVRDFSQIYAIAKHNSKTSGEDFAHFIERLGVDTEEIENDQWFYPDAVARVFKVEEPSFDAVELRKLLSEEIETTSSISLLLNTAVIGGSAGNGEIFLELNNGTRINAGGLVIAAYAGTNGIRKSLNLGPLPLMFELAEVILGDVRADYENLGFTIMDGPFWSLMPFGHSGKSTLTSVGLTPIERAEGNPTFSCQSKREGCGPQSLADCNSCAVRPVSGFEHQIQQMSLFLKDVSFFKPTGSLLTVKSVLASSEVDDARPTLIHKEIDALVWTVFSGKVSTLFDLEGELM